MHRIRVNKNELKPLVLVADRIYTEAFDFSEILFSATLTQDGYFYTMLDELSTCIDYLEEKINACPIATVTISAGKFDSLLDTADSFICMFENIKAGLGSKKYNRLITNWKKNKTKYFSYNS